MGGQCSWLETEFRQLARVENRASLRGWDTGNCSRWSVRLAEAIEMIAYLQKVEGSVLEVRAINAAGE
jgi:hypothetical protein